MGGFASPSKRHRISSRIFGEIDLLWLAQDRSIQTVFSAERIVIRTYKRTPCRRSLAGRPIAELPYPRAKSHRQVPVSTRVMLSARARAIGASEGSAVA
jgi:hypothetical protein